MDAPAAAPPGADRGASGGPAHRDRLVLQIDGAHHTGAQRDEDIAHDATLTLMGYHVIRVSYRHVVDDWASVQDTIMRAVAQGLHRAR